MRDDELELRGHRFGTYVDTSTTYTCKRCSVTHNPKAAELGNEPSLILCDGPEYIEPEEPEVIEPIKPKVKRIRKPKYELTVI